MAVDVLVTGACGVLGRHIVQKLRNSGRKVVASGRVAGPDADVIWDISLKDRPQPDCNPAAVVHAAARVGSYQQPLSEATTLFDVNVTGTLKVAQWCVSHQVKRLVLISGAILYGEWTGTPKSEEAAVNPWLAGPYAVSKWCGEQAALVVRPTDVELTILRLSSLYGPGYKRGLIQRLLKQGMETGNINLAPPFDDAFDLLNVHDAAATVERALEAEHAGLWNVGGGRLTTIGELAELCAKNVGAELTLSEVSPVRPRRIINWVKDEKARMELGHINQISVDAGVEAVTYQNRAAGAQTINC